MDHGIIYDNRINLFSSNRHGKLWLQHYFSFEVTLSVDNQVNYSGIIYSYSAMPSVLINSLIMYLRLM